MSNLESNRYNNLTVKDCILNVIYHNSTFTISS